MKKIAIQLLIILFVISSNAFAGNGDLFSFDKEKIQSEMATLDQLEQIVDQSQDLTYDDLMESQHPLAMELNYGSSMNLTGMSAGPIIPSFWWGCLFGPVGMLVVFLVEDDRDETMSAFWGCVISSIVFGAGYGIAALTGWGWW